MHREKSKIYPDKYCDKLGFGSIKV